MTDWEFDASYPNLRCAFARQTSGMVKYYTVDQGLVTEEVAGMRCRIMQRLIATLEGQPLSSGSKLAMVNLDNRKSQQLADLASAESPVNLEFETLEEDLTSDDEVNEKEAKRAMEAEDILESWFGERKVDKNYLTTKRLYKSIDSSHY